jgi:Protein of unknown function (DUF2917)
MAPIRRHSTMIVEHATAGGLEPLMNRPDSLTLDRNRCATLRGAAQIRVTHGSLWLTIDGEIDDFFIERGQGVALPAGARALVQALHAPARAVVLRPVGWRDRALAAWQALIHRPAGARA